LGRAYDIIDADGHVLEPLDLWTEYMDPAYRGRAPRLINDADGKQRLLIESKVLADYIGPHKILWATDYPHPDGFFPGAPKMIERRLAGVSP
jgi:hypothetical protein